MPSSIPESAINSLARAGADARRTSEAGHRVKRFLYRLVRKRSSAVGLLLTALFVAVAALAPLLASYPLLALGDSFVPPGSGHFFGTDAIGNDVYSNVVRGARTSLVVGFVAVLTSTFIGIVVGATSGFFGGRVDQVLMRLTEMFQILPQFFLAIVIVALFGSSIWIIIFVIGMLTWPATARMTRAEFLTLKKREFAEAARALGMTNFDLILRELLPNALPPIVINATLQISGAILLETSLSFLGLGDPTVMSWGVMLHNAQESFSRAWWMAAFPGMAIFLTTLGLNLVGDGLNDALNPRVKI
jgi:peptide/nickel transport system permease protein